MQSTTTESSGLLSSPVAADTLATPAPVPAPAAAATRAVGASPSSSTVSVSVSAASAPRPRLLILYGSQTGCAQDVAEHIKREGRARGFAVRCQSMDTYDRRQLPSEPLVAFVCSTTGQGESPDNMRSFYRFLLRRDLPSDSLSALSFAVFGLGDSSYPLFNAIARRIHQRLIELGGRALLNRGLGDDQDERGVDEALDPWLTQLWEILADKYGTLKGTLVQDAIEEPKYHVEIIRHSDMEQKMSEQQTITASSSAHSQDGPDRKSSSPRAASSAAATSASAASSSGLPVLVPPVELPPFLAHIPAQRYAPVPLRMVVNKRLTPTSHFQDVRHIEFELPPRHANSNGDDASRHARPHHHHKRQDVPPHPHAESFNYQPGDVLFIHPRNVLDEEMIGFVGRTFGVDYHRDWCTIQLTKHWKQQQGQTDGSVQPHPNDNTDGCVTDEDDLHEYPHRCSIRDLFELHLDILGTPRRTFFQLLRPHAGTEMERERLDELAAANGYKDLARYCTKEKRMYLEVFADFPHSIPANLDHVLQLIPRLQPRQFSIASSRDMHPNHVHILMALLQIKTPFGRKRTGVLSEWFDKLDPEKGEIWVPCWLKGNSSSGVAATPGRGSVGSFRPPADPYTPTILIGPGTGIAPFRAMVESRAVRKRLLEQETYEHEPDTDPESDDPPQRMYTPYLVLFGNRNRKADYFYEDEWESHVEEHVCEMHTVFSRDPVDEDGDASDDRMRYVQHILTKKLAPRVARMLTVEGGVVMVAGSANQMPKDVRAAIMAILEAYGDDGQGWSEERAAQHLKMMDIKRRYLVETW